MALDTGKVINRAQFTEILMMAGVIARVNELGSGKPELLTWTNRRGETIGNGLTWNTAEASTKDASMTSDVAGETKDDDDDVVVVAEEDRGAIALGLSPNLTTSYLFLALDTGKLIN